MIIEETKWLLDYEYTIELIINASNGHNFTAEVKAYKLLKFDNDLGKPIYQVRGESEDCFTYNLNKAILSFVLMLEKTALINGEIRKQFTLSTPTEYSLALNLNNLCLNEVIKECFRLTEELVGKDNKVF